MGEGLFRKLSFCSHWFWSQYPFKKLKIKFLILLFPHIFSVSPLPHQSLWQLSETTANPHDHPGPQAPAPEAAFTHTPCRAGSSWEAGHHQPRRAATPTGKTAPIPQRGWPLGYNGQGPSPTSVPCSQKMEKTRGRGCSSRTPMHEGPSHHCRQPDPLSGSAHLSQLPASGSRVRPPHTMPAMETRWPPRPPHPLLPLPSILALPLTTILSTTFLHEAYEPPTTDQPVKRRTPSTFPFPQLCPCGYLCSGCLLCPDAKPSSESHRAGLDPDHRRKALCCVLHGHLHWILTPQPLCSHLSLSVLEAQGCPTANALKGECSARQPGCSLALIQVDAVGSSSREPPGPLPHHCGAGGQEEEGECELLGSCHGRGHIRGQRHSVLMSACSRTLQVCASRVSTLESTPTGPQSSWSPPTPRNHSPSSITRLQHSQTQRQVPFQWPQIRHFIQTQ